MVFDDSTGIGIVSITDYAQKSLGDVVFVELPALQTKVTKGGLELARSSRFLPASDFREFVFGTSFCCIASPMCCAVRT